MQKKWQKVVANAHRDKFKIFGIKIKEAVTGKQIPDCTLKVSSPFMNTREKNGVTCC